MWAAPTLFSVGIWVQPCLTSPFYPWVCLSFHLTPAHLLGAINRCDAPSQWLCHSMGVLACKKPLEARPAHQVQPSACPSAHGGGRDCAQTFQPRPQESHPTASLTPSLCFQAFYYPEEAGLAFGGAHSSRYLRLEIHYHNPLAFKGEWVRSNAQCLPSEAAARESPLLGEAPCFMQKKMGKITALFATFWRPDGPHHSWQEE